MHSTAILFSSSLAKATYHLQGVIMLAGISACQGYARHICLLQKCSMYARQPCLLPEMPSDFNMKLVIP